ncbi:MAG TPA: endonuclease/exonuclease/phosphatase family protein [Acidimicrobiales bacterium]|nr:endonuclease/exonuclease/phosphatase family protein [Acidimicrobiales bacterium]
MTTLRLMTYNMLHAPGERLAPLVEVVKGVGPDILACQEVNTFEGMMSLSRELGMLPIWGAANSPEDYRNGGPVYEHLVVFTRLAPRSVRVHPGDRRAMFRPVLEVRLRPPGAPELSVFTVHMRALVDPSERYLKFRELGSLLTVLADAEGPVIAMGDFNARAPGEGTVAPPSGQELPDDHLHAVQGAVIGAIVDAGFLDSYRLVHPGGQHDESTLLNRAGSRVDHIFVNPLLGPYVTDSYIVDDQTVRNASDHRPVVTELTFGERDETSASADGVHAAPRDQVRR